MFCVTRGLVYCDPDGPVIGYDDGFAKIEQAGEHNERVGLGADFVVQFVRQNTHRVTGGTNARFSSWLEAIKRGVGARTSPPDSARKRLWQSCQMHVYKACGGGVADASPGFPAPFSRHHEAADHLRDEAGLVRLVLDDLAADLCRAGETATPQHAGEGKQGDANTSSGGCDEQDAIPLSRG